MTTQPISATPILDSLYDGSGNSIGEMARGTLTSLVTQSLGTLYWRKAVEAKRDGDTIAAEYWTQHALAKMSPADKRKNFLV